MAHGSSTAASSASAAACTAFGASTVLALALVLGACGGGGDDGAGEPTPPTGGPPPVTDPPPENDPPSALSVEHAGGALGFVDNIASVHTMLVSASQIARYHPPDRPLVVECDESGSIELGYVDNDAAYRATTGDEVYVAYQNCDGATFEARLVLTAHERFFEDRPDGSVRRLAGHASVSVETAWMIAVLREATFDILFESHDDHVRWRADNVAALIEHDVIEHTRAGGWIERVYDADGNHVTLAGELGGQPSGAPVDFATGLALSAPFGDMPVTGMMVLSDGELSARLVPGETAGDAVFQPLSAADEPIGDSTAVSWEVLMRGTPFEYHTGGSLVSGVEIRWLGAEEDLTAWFMHHSTGGRPAERTFRWSVNGAVLEDEIERTLAAMHFQPGDLVELVVTLDDGIRASSAAASRVINGS